MLQAALFSDEALKMLKSRVQGSVIVPGNAQYDEARQAWNLSVDQHPAVIVIAYTTGDVAEAINFARKERLGIAVQATGHGVSRGADGGLLLITSQMTKVEVDAEEQTAWIEGGAMWKMVLEKTAPLGLAPLLGSSPGVGVVGYTLGGGMGWLARKYGLSADSVIYFEVVTAEGRVLHAGKEENSDLFWALRGGGGSFGVITGLKIRLYPVSTIYGGSMIYPIEMAKEVMSRYREWIANAPEELTSSVVLMNFPPVPAVPEFLRGKSAVMIRGAYVGAVEEGQTLIQQWLDWREPMVNLFHEMPFSQIGTVSNDPVDPMPGLSSGAWVRELSDEAIDTLIQYGVASNGSKVVFAELRHAGGAIARVSKEESAFSNRDALLSLQMVGVTPTPEVHQDMREFMSEFKRALQPVLTGGVYMNFLEGSEKWDRTKDGYRSESYQRLMEVKAKYDPNNVFNRSFNIPPATK